MWKLGIAGRAIVVGVNGRRGTVAHLGRKETPLQNEQFQLLGTPLRTSGLRQHAQLLVLHLHQLLLAIQLNHERNHNHEQTAAEDPSRLARREQPLAHGLVVR